MGVLTDLLKKTVREDEQDVITGLREARRIKTGEFAQPTLEEVKQSITPESPYFRTTGEYVPTSAKPTLAEIKAGTEQRRAERTTLAGQLGEFTQPSDIERYKQQEQDVKAKEEQRKQTLQGAEERLKNLLKESKEIERSPEPDFQKQNELTRQIVETRNLITANQPGFKTGLRESVGLEPTAKFAAQKVGERAMSFEQAKEEARGQKGFATGRVVGELGKQATLYATIGSALKGTQLGSKLAAKVGTFASDQIVDLLVDTIIQTPQEIARGEDLAQIGINRLIDVGMNLGIDLGAKYFRNLKQIDPKGFDDAVRQLSPEQANTVRQTLGEAPRVDLQPGLVKDVPGVQALRGAEVAAQPQVGPLSKLLKEQPIRQVDEVVDVARQVEAPNGSLTRLLREEPTTAAKAIDDDMATTIPLAKQVDDEMVSNLKERGFSENIATDIAREEKLQSTFDQDPLYYSQLANKTVLDKAQARFDKGFDAAYDDFKSSIKTRMNPEDVVLAKLIADEATRQGDIRLAREVISDAAEKLTTAGQFSQAAKILRQSNDPSAVIKYIDDELKKLNDLGRRQFGKKWTDLNLTPDEENLIKQMQDATDEQKQQIFEQIYNSISKRIPVTNMEKFDAWRRISMLFNPKTHIRNIAGNTIMAGTKKVADSIATAMEKFVPKNYRTKAMFPSPERKQIAQMYWDANKKQLAEGSRWEIFGIKSPFAEKEIFQNPLMKSINDLSMKTLEGEDIFFLKRHFVRDLSGFMQSRGLAEPTQEAIDYALRRAQEATFREANAFADALGKMKGSKGFGKLVDAAMPFTKTPANILKTGIDYSPIGVVKSVFDLANNAPPQQFIETLSKGLTGSGLALTGFYMAKNGMVRGDYTGDAAEESLLTRAGRLPNSLVLPNGSYTIDWAQPTAIPFFMGVAYQEALEGQRAQGDDVDLVEATWEALLNSGESLINQSMLRGISDLFGGYGTTTEKLVGLPVSYLEQGIPTLLGQIARSVDPTKRQRDYSTLLSAAETRTISKIPGLSETLPAKYDLLGEVQQYGTGVSNVLQQFLSPGYVGTPKEDQVTQELVRLYDEVGADFLPRQNVRNFSYDGVKYELDSEEQSQFQERMGANTKELLTKLLGSIEYKRASDEEKADLISKIDTESYKKTKVDYLKERGILND